MTKDEALKMAIDSLTAISYSHDGYARKEAEKALNACKEALEQPTQTYIVNNTASTQFQLYEQPAQEPIYIIGEGWNCDKFPELGTKLYTHPKQWQGLTDDEIEELHHKWIMNSGNKDTQYDFARAIEKKLMDKNT